MKRPFGVLGLAVVAMAMAQAVVWKQAAPGRAITLPADHASHPDYKIEWWYYTGNVDAGDRSRFGYQLTFFRVGVDPVPASRSLWAVRDLFTTHLALSDIDGHRYRFSDRLNRAGPDWAGAATDTYRVWNEDWQATIDPDGRHHLQAAGPGFGLDLHLTQNRPVVLHGDHGYSQKGSAAGNASYYYSLTRMPTTGTITIDGRAVPVTGQSWMDHEFGTSVLEQGQSGWDWFSIQLDDGRDLMIFQLRRADGSMDPHSSGTLVEVDGRVIPIRVTDRFHLEPGRRWTSPTSRAAYPVAWEVRVPSADVDLTVTAALDAQELNTEHSTGVTYWEGAVVASGRVHGRNTRGRGYLEMTGYTGASMSSIMR
jgi:predicted secreted hydrolase